MIWHRKTKKIAIVLLACMLFGALPACASSSNSDEVPADGGQEIKDECIMDVMREDEAMNETGKGSIEKSGDDLESGGPYSSLWYLTGKVSSLDEGSFVLDAEDARYEVDCLGAQKAGRALVRMEIGDEVQVGYFLYDIDGGSVKAYSVELISRNG